MRIFIEPTEPLMFRTGRPFTAGEHTFAESMFPPTPETLQGAMRAAIAVHWGQAQHPPQSQSRDLFEQRELNRLIGKRLDSRDTYGQFRITGFTLGRRNHNTHKIERLFPPPAHIMRVTIKDETNGDEIQRLVLLRPEERKAGTTNMPDDCSLLFPVMQNQKSVGKAEALTEWLTPLGLGAVLRGELPPEDEEHLVKTNSIYTYEPRLGIGMHNHEKKTKEGYLYQVQMVRMYPDYGFVVDIACGEEAYGAADLPPAQERRTDAAQELAFMTSGWLTLGGEQRAAHFTVLNPQEIAEERGATHIASGNLLYFATPAYLKQGWLPENKTLFPAALKTAAVNHPQSIGGWYLNTHDAGGGYKMMRRCVPAGSVYFFDEKIKVQQPLTEYGWQIGFGITYTGEWK